MYGNCLCRGLVLVRLVPVFDAADGSARNRRVHWVTLITLVAVVSFQWRGMKYFLGRQVQGGKGNARVDESTPQTIPDEPRVEPPNQWMHRLPRARGVDKEEYLKEAVRDLSVVHVGFWGLADPTRREALEGVWLHAELAKTAKCLIGLDIDPLGVEEARSAGFAAYAVDCRDPLGIKELGVHGELVLAGELIEHLDSPGQFLEAMHYLGDTLILTTPCATSLISFTLALVHREGINPGHVALYSWYTLTNILQQHGWGVREVLVYHYPNLPRRRTGLHGIARHLAIGAVVKLQRLLAKASPFVDHGLIMVCDKNVQSSA